MADLRQHAPATERNREPIYQVLQRVLPAVGLVLEVASGSGQHTAFLAPRFPRLTWQPSDADAAMHASIRAWTARVTNVQEPVYLDASTDVWPLTAANAVVCINMIHIAPWNACMGLLRGAARILTPRGVLYLYGPYMRGGQHTAPSNAAFDASLRARNPEWGVRDLDAVAAHAHAQGLVVRETVAMPANNLSVIFERSSAPSPSR